MPGFLLDASSTVMCAHGGQAQPTAVNARVSVGGQPTLVLSSSHVVSACSFSTPGGPNPCVTAQWVVAATRVLSSGQPVLLKDSQAICTPNGTPLNVTVTQLRVMGT